MSEALDILSNHVRSQKTSLSLQPVYICTQNFRPSNSFSYCDNIIFFFKFNLCKYLGIYGLKVLNITDCLILILKVVRLIVTILVLVLFFYYYYYYYNIFSSSIFLVLVYERGLCEDL